MYMYMYMYGMTYTVIHVHYNFPRVTKLGGVAISDGEKEAILNARKEAQCLYQQVGTIMMKTFCFDDPVPIPCNSVIVELPHLLTSTITQIQSVFVGEPEEKLTNTLIIIPSSTPIITMHGVGAIRPSIGLCKLPGKLSYSYEVKRG